MPVANDFLTWPRSFKEQRKKIPQDAAVQGVTNSSSQTKYEAEDTLENDYNLLKQQVYIPAVWRRNSKGDHPTRKSTSHLLPETGSGFWGQNGASSTSCPLCLLADSALRSIFFCPQKRSDSCSEQLWEMELSICGQLLMAQHFYYRL